MASSDNSAEASEVFECTPSQFFQIVSDYERYPEFLSEVKSCRVIEVQGARKKVEYEVSLIKRVTYSLWHTEQKDQRIDWEFASGDLFRTCSGYWLITPEANHCRAVYHVKASFGIFVPKTITRSLLSMNLPNMMSAYHKRVKDLFAGG